MNVLQKNIKSYLDRNGMTAIQLCRTAGIPKHSIGNIMSGNSRKPSGDILVRLARAMSCSPEDLLDPESFDPLAHKITSDNSSNDFTNKFKSLDWNPDLFIKIVKSIDYLTKEKNVVLPSIKALNLCLECYTYMMKEQDGKFDEGFVRWYVSKEFPV